MATRVSLLFIVLRALFAQVNVGTKALWPRLGRTRYRRLLGKGWRRALSTLLIASLLGLDASPAIARVMHPISGGVGVIRQKTVEYVWAQNEATLASATDFDFAGITVALPETTSRTFRSVIIEITCLQDATTAGNITASKIEVQIDAVAFSAVGTVTTTQTNSGEKMSFRRDQDVTSYFTTNFTGASHTVKARVNVTNGATPNTVSNLTAKLYVTYDYDDSVTTHVKTVKVPLDGATGALTTSLTELGTNQVPHLDTFLPEASKVYRDIWFEIECNEANSAATQDPTLNLALDAEAADADFAHENGLTSSCDYRRIWKRTDMATNATHAFKSATSHANSDFRGHSVLLCVTYEFDSTASNSALNSIAIPFCLSSTPDASGLDRDIVFEVWIEEPATIALVQSGAVFYGSVSSSSQNPTLLFGAQSGATTTWSAAVLYSGQVACSKRLDNASSGITLARGRNTFQVFMSTQTGTGHVVGVLYLNYTSGKATAGYGAHNHTVRHHQYDYSTATGSRSTTTHAVPVPESNYWISAHGAVVVATNAAINTVMQLETDVRVTEGEGAGSLISETQYVVSDTENGWFYFIWEFGFGTQKHRWFDRYPADEMDGLDVEATRTVALLAGGASHSYFYTLTTYHAILPVLTGNIQGGNAAGANYNVDIHRLTGGPRWGMAERLTRLLTAAAATSYSITSHDDAETKFVHARQDANRHGRSEDGTAGGDIDLVRQNVPAVPIIIPM